MLGDTSGKLLESKDDLPEFPDDKFYVLEREGVAKLLNVQSSILPMTLKNIADRGEYEEKGPAKASGGGRGGRGGDGHRDQDSAAG